MKNLLKLLSLLLVSATLVSCSTDEEAQPSGKVGVNKTRTAYPLDDEDQRTLDRGKLGGEGGLFGPNKNNNNGTAVLGINSYLWRATLDTISFIPLASADPVGGVIITEWYQDPAAQGEKIKLNVLITSPELRSDAIRVSVFKQAGGKDVQVNPEVGKQLEDKILARARELKINDKRL